MIVTGKPLHVLLRLEPHSEKHPNDSNNGFPIFSRRQSVSLSAQGEGIFPSLCSAACERSWRTGSFAFSLDNPRAESGTVGHFLSRALQNFLIRRAFKVMIYYGGENTLGRALPLFSGGGQNKATLSQSSHCAYIWTF